MRPQDVIRKKRDGQPLSHEEIKFFIDGVTHGQIADYQISALLMAIYLNGMNHAEQQALTESMLQSGSILDFPTFPNQKQISIRRAALATRLHCSSRQW